MLGATADRKEADATPFSCRILAHDFALVLSVSCSVIPYEYQWLQKKDFGQNRELAVVGLHPRALR